MSARVRVALAALWVLCTAAPVLAEDPPAAASGSDRQSDVERARQHFRAGVDYYRDGDLAASLVEFKRAYATAPNYRVLYNLGQVSQELREYPDAKRYYERYLHEAGDALDASRKQEVAAALLKVRSRIAELMLSSSASDAEYFVDDVSLGRGPFDEPVLVSAGSHRVSASAPGRVRTTQVIDAAGGETLAIQLDLPQIELAQTREPQPTPAAGGSSPRTDEAGPGPALWLGISTGVLAAGAGVLSALAARDGADYRAALERKTTPKELDDLHDSATAKALAADILWGATAVTGALTLYFALSDDGSERQPDARARLDLGPGRIDLRGRF
jgi:tetratricopeptide (TPR) repeat protein